MELSAHLELAPLPGARSAPSSAARSANRRTRSGWRARAQVVDGRHVLLSKRRRRPTTGSPSASDASSRAAARRVFGAGHQVEFARSRATDRRRATRPPATRPSTSTPVALNPRYSFDQFIIGDGNRLAHAAALAVAENPGQAYNPLFLHAPPGLGKTHLLHAIGNYMLAFGGGAAVRYTTVEAFTNSFITALGTRSLDRFKHAYRDADVLLIDDVQFLASKAKTEEEFFHTFNAVYETGRQLVLTCDRLPSQLLAVEERLRDRFESGLVAVITPPDHADPRRDPPQARRARPHPDRPTAPSSS